MQMKKIQLIFLFLLCIQHSLSDFRLNIIHFNDIHAHFEQTNTYSGMCRPAQEENNECYGGIARFSTKVKELKSSLENVIVLNGGDNYKGTAWYSVHKWTVFAYFFNLLPQDVMVLGNHDFDDGISGIVPLIENLTFPVISANIDDTYEPDFQNQIKSSVILDVNGTKVGIIGYTTQTTETTSWAGNLTFLDEITSVQAEATILKESGVDIIIALGHSGIDIDMNIAELIEEIDIVVGSHSHTFLYTGEEPSIENSAGNYPIVVTQNSGKQVPIVQAYAFGKYLGHIDVLFDDDGNVIEWNGFPILLSSAVSQDPMILEEMVPWREEIDESVGYSVGRTLVYLDGITCNMAECNLGNLFADSYVYENVHYPVNDTWTRTSLAIMSADSIKDSFDETSNNGSITLEDLMMATPYENTIDIIQLQGLYVKQMFEESVQDYDVEGLNPPGSFLQVSGFKIVYNTSMASGSRVVSIETLCMECRIPEYEPLDVNQVYSIAMQTWLANGATVFTSIKEHKISHYSTGIMDIDVIAKYLEFASPIYQGVEGRIEFT